MSNQIQSVSFHNQKITVLNHDNKPYIAIKPICENIGLDWEAQRQRIKRNEILNSTAFMIKVVAKDGKNRDVLCLPLGYLNGWLAGIDLNRVNPAIKPMLKQYQLECFDVLYNHFMPKIAQQYPNTITPEQQQSIREAVKIRTERTGEKYAAVYARLANKFKIARYQQLPASKFDEAIEYLGKTINTIEFTHQEACVLCWLCKASARMRQSHEALTEGLFNLKSDYAPSFQGMAAHYIRLIEEAKVILEKKTKHIKPKLEGTQEDNWQNVLMFIRG